MWLNEARGAALEAKLQTSNWIELSSQSCLFFPWCGTKTLLTIGLFAKDAGIEWTNRDGVAIQFKGSIAEVRTRILALLKDAPSPEVIADLAVNQLFRKYDNYLPEEILRSSFIDNVMNYAFALQVLKQVL